MRAVVYDKRSPDRLVLREVEKPSPGDDEVLVKIHATSVNAADYRAMRMGIRSKRGIYGADIAGRVEAVGRNVGSLVPGDEVFGDILGAGFGGFAEYVAVPEAALALKPAGVPFWLAATVPIAAVTALQALRNGGGAAPGQRVLVYGAGGGVGTFAVQLAKCHGAEVTAVCSEENAQLARSLGADHVLDYHAEDFAKRHDRYDTVLAINGNRALSAYRRVLRPHGTCVIVGGALSQLIGAMVLGRFLSRGGKKMVLLAAKPNKEDLESLIRLVEQGRIRPAIDRRYPLHETAEAVRYLSAGHAKGKVVIDVCAED